MLQLMLQNFNIFETKETAFSFLSSYLKNKKKHFQINNELSEKTSMI